MTERNRIDEELLDNVSGGAITYTWDGEKGSLGMNGKNTYMLLDKSAFLEVYNELFGKVSNAEIIRNLREQGIIKKPE